MAQLPKRITQLLKNYTRPVMLDLSQFGDPYWDHVLITNGYAPQTGLIARMSDPQGHNINRIPLTLEGEDVQAIIFLQGDVICDVEEVAGLTVFAEKANVSETDHALMFFRAQAVFRVAVNPVVVSGRDRFYWHLVHPNDEPHYADIPFLRDGQKLPHNPTGVCGPDYEAPSQ